jgi:hypothetical protein
MWDCDPPHRFIADGGETKTDDRYTCEHKYFSFSIWHNSNTWETQLCSYTLRTVASRDRTEKHLKPKPSQSKIFWKNDRAKGTLPSHNNPKFDHPPPFPTFKTEMSRCTSHALSSSIISPRYAPSGAPSIVHQLAFLEGISRDPCPTLTSPRFGYLQSQLRQFGAPVDNGSTTPEDARARTLSIISDVLELIKDSDDHFGQ